MGRAKPGRGVLAIIGPGVLVAATGVGAGDLAGAGFAGSKLGVAVLWAVLLGAAMKFVITENLARWQIATGQTILEGALVQLGRPVQLLLLLYILPWTFFTSGAIVSACGVTAHALLPVFDDAQTGKLVLGMACSGIGLALVWLGGFKLFERVMAGCVAVMFGIVVVTAAIVARDWGAILTGLFLPRVPDGAGEGVAWTVALIGGVGGTLTVICYSYWMRETGRDGPSHLGTARLDALVGYGMTAIFGIAMVIIASGIDVTGRGAGLIVGLADELGDAIGPAGRLAFLVGAFAAVFSSLLGVWQAVPYVYADMWGLRGSVGRRDVMPDVRVDTRGAPYRIVLVAIALVPLLSLPFSFETVQKAYAVYGAMFLPGLAAVLIVLNARPSLGTLRNRWWMGAMLGAIVAFFLGVVWLEVQKRFG